MSKDPWSQIVTPSGSALINGRRVSAENRWHFFWAKDYLGKCLLVLQHDESASPIDKLPKPKGLSVEITTPELGKRSLILKLMETSQRDIFFKLANDIIQAAEEATLESEAVSLALARTWRWHHLLKGGTGGRLSDEEQKGLIGELIIIKRYLLPSLSPIAAISSWLGPLGAPKDFEIGRLAIEAKARRGSAVPFIKISSEHQLDSSGCDCLLLHVVELDRLPSDAEPGNAISVSSLCADVRNELQQADLTALDMFDACLISAGVRPEDDYTDDLWLEGRSRQFHVHEGFPRITAATTDSGVRSVQYSIDLAACESHAVNATRIAQELGRIGHV